MNMIGGRYHSWPLYECIPREDLAELMLYQWKHYETRLDVAPSPTGESLYHPEPDMDEIDKVMRGRPSSKGR